MKQAIIGLCLLVAGIALIAAVRLGQTGNSDATSGTDADSYEYYYSDQKQGDDTTSTSESKKIKVNVNPNSVSVLVNRKYRMDKDYVPKDLVVPDIPFTFYGTYERSYVRRVTADALEKMFAAAAKKNCQLMGVSGYRSYERQKQIYDNNVNTRGTSSTDKVSAKPGSSEHQTGLAIDVSSSSNGGEIDEAFADTPEGKWLARNCSKYGFIIRYPKGKSDITGYSYEPWHIRYVGKKLAAYLAEQQLALEEYYQTTTEENKIDEEKPSYNDTDKDDLKDEQQMKTPPTPRPTKQPTATPKTKSKVKKKPKKTAKPKRTQKPVATQHTETTQAPVQPPTEAPTDANTTIAEPTPAQGTQAPQAPVTESVE